MKVDQLFNDIPGAVTPTALDVAKINAASLSQTFGDVRIAFRRAMDLNEMTVNDGPRCYCYYRYQCDEADGKGKVHVFKHSVSRAYLRVPAFQKRA